MPREVAVWSPGTVFHTFAMRLEGNNLNPGTGGQIFFDSAKRVFLLLGFSEKRCTPKGFISCLDFQTMTAIADAVASFRQRSPAFERVISERILSESFVLVMERAADLMALFISSVIVFEPVSSGSILIGMVAGAAARILPIKSPFANVARRFGGIPKLRRFIRAALVFA
jgi:hypothetical protein